MARRLASIVLLGIVLSACTVTFTRTGDSTDYYRPDPGVILFGTGLDPTFTMVKNPTTTIGLTEDGKMSFAGVFPRGVTGEVRLRITKDGGSLFDVPLSSSDAGEVGWYSGKYFFKDLSGPGHYVFSMVQGSELLATGAVDITHDAFPSN
jgi:hypothetical protein